MKRNLESGDRVIRVDKNDDRGIVQDYDPMKSNYITGTAPGRNDMVYVAWLWPLSLGIWELSSGLLKA